MPLITNAGRTQGQPYNHVVYAATATTATHSTAYFENPGNYRGIRLYIEATAASATPSVVFTVQVKNHKTGTYHTVLTTAAVTAVSNNVYEVYPDGAAVANLRATYHVGRGFRVTATHADADSITYGIWADWLP